MRRTSATSALASANCPNWAYAAAIARDIVGSELPDADKKFTALIDEIFAWAGDGG